MGWILAQPSADGVALGGRTDWPDERSMNDEPLDLEATRDRSATPIFVWWYSRRYLSGHNPTRPFALVLCGLGDDRPEGREGDGRREKRVDWCSVSRLIDDFDHR